MKPYEIFRRLSTAEADSLVFSACEDDEIPDKVAGSVLTLQRVPLKRFERMTDEVRRALVRKTLRDKRAEDLALFVLSAGLVRARSEMIEGFLSSLELPHDGPNLTADEPVAEPARERLTKAVADLAGTHGARDAALFLHAFVEQPDVAWPVLSELLAGDPKLALEDRSAD